MSIKPLRDQGDPATRFSDRVRDYERFRPSYPPPAIDAILDGLGDPATLVAADVGAGTGISARLLAARAVHVHAIEPNNEMREAGERAGSGGPGRIDWRDATGEATGLPDHSVDLITCAQAYHWLDPDRAATEFTRILKPGGRIALMWNDWDETHPVTSGYSRLIRRHCTGLPPHHEEWTPTVSGKLMVTGTRRFPHAQRLDAEGLVGRAMSASYVPKQGPAHDAIVSGLRALHAEHAGADGLVDLAYETWVCFVGT
jgi:SAM-dependent methyltransferase